MDDFDNEGIIGELTYAQIEKDPSDLIDAFATFVASGDFSELGLLARAAYEQAAETLADMRSGGGER